MHILEKAISEQYSLVLMQLSTVESTWFERSCQVLEDKVQALLNREELATSWATVSAESAVYLKNSDIPVCIPELQGKEWKAIELARFQSLANLLQALEQKKRRGVLETCLRYADDNEKQAICKGFCLLDPAGECQSSIANLCRTNNRDLFAAIALENSWPAQHFSDMSFEQMLLKALFLGLDINKVVGVKERHSQRMSRLAFDYLSELIAANRTWPPSIYTSIDFNDLTNEQHQRLANFPEQIKKTLTTSLTTH